METRLINPLPAGSAAGREAVQPASLTGRIPSIDVLRGVALLGILMMNILGFGVSRAINGNPEAYGGTTGINIAIFIAQFLLFEGRMRALFSILFGAGALLFLAKPEVPNQVPVADLYYRRLLWLLVFGLVDAYLLLWTGDILYTYALCGLFLFPFRRVSPNYLLLIGLLVLLKPTIQGQLQYVNDVRNVRTIYLETEAALKKGQTLTGDQQEARKRWEALTKGPDSKSVVETDNKIMRGSYGAIFQKVLHDNQKLQSTDFYQYTFWDSIGMMFIGMALFKWGVLTERLRRRQYAWLAGAGLVSGLALGGWMIGYMISITGDYGKGVDANPINVPVVTYHARRLTVVLAHIALIMIVLKSGWLNRLTNALAAVGQMAFTNYLMQSILCGLFFYGFGLGYYGKLDRYELYFVVLGVWVIQLIYSPIWLRYFRFGPMEWAWRSLTYWKRQPMRRDTAPTEITRLPL